MAAQPLAYEDSTLVPVTTSESCSERPDSQKNHKQDFSNEKNGSAEVVDDAPPRYDAEAEDHFGETTVVSTAKDLVTHILHVQDDPSLNPWTFRMFFLGKCSIISFEFPG